jgi:hypothetical protein
MTADEIMEELAQFVALLASVTSPENAAEILRAMADEIAELQGTALQ